MTARRSTDLVALVALAAAACAPRAMPREPEPLIAEPAPAPVHATARLPAPATDDDGDGITAWDDLCPGAAEDEDGFADDDGCPDPDDDEDGRLDVDDACPEQAAATADGCPAAAATPAVEPVTRVEFRRGSAEVAGPARTVLDAVAATLAAHPEVAQLELVGHRDAAERRGGLDVARAQAVARYLEARGVAAERLTVRGDGISPPARVELRVRLAVQR